MPLPTAGWTLPPFIPDPSNILCGLATASGGTLITVPAGKTWQGTVTMTASVVVAAAGSALNASARVSTLGVGAQPPPGDYIRIDLGAPAGAAAVAGTADSGMVSSPMLLAAPAGNSVSLVLNTTGTTAQSASAVGVLF